MWRVANLRRSSPLWMNSWGITNYRVRYSSTSIESMRSSNSSIKRRAINDVQKWTMKIPIWLVPNGPFIFIGRVISFWKWEKLIIIISSCLQFEIVKSSISPYAAVYHCSQHQHQQQTNTLPFAGVQLSLRSYEPYYQPLVMRTMKINRFTCVGEM